MSNANINKVIPILIATAILFIAGCSSPEEKKAQKLAEAAQLEVAGDANAALELLEKLSQKYLDDSEILQKIGLIHQKMGNHPEAAFYLSAAQSLSPDDSELLLQTYLAQENAGQPESAYDLLEVFAKSNPTDMTGVLWFRLGELRTKNQKTQAALEAYMEGVKLSNQRPSNEVALAIGTLFKQSNNMPMASRWLSIAAKSDDPNALPALFGLLEIHLRSKNWEASEKTIALLDKKFPGAVDASEWSKARTELRKWREAQQKMESRLAKMEEAKRQEQIKKQEEAQKLAQARKNAAIESSGTVSQSQTTALETSGKGQAIPDIANAKALASKPAAETSSAKPESAETSSVKPESAEPEIAYNPSILIQPAEPIADIEEDTEQEIQNVQLPADYATNYQSSATQPEPIQAEPVAEFEPLPEPKPRPKPKAYVPDTASLSIEELIARAEESTAARNYDKAIQFYWDVLGQTNQRADIWSALSKVYLIDGQTKNAATTALEATRLEPENAGYVLDYLRVVQRIKKPADFIKELETAYDRFPRSPEIILSLARGYRRVSGNDYAAKVLYQRFIKIAPKHPLRAEAEAALSAIR